MGDLILHRSSAGKTIGIGCGAGAALALVVVLLASPVFITPAFGQQAYQESVRQRPRLDYESFGFSFRALQGDRERSGPRKPADQVVVYSRVDMGAGYRSNLFRTPNNARGASFAKIEPFLALRTDWDRHGVNVLLKADSEVFVSDSDESKLDLSGRIDGTYEFSFDKVGSWQAEIGRSQAPRGSGDDSGPGFEPQLINSYGVGIGYSDGSREQVALSAGATFNHYDYQKVNGQSRDLLNYDEIKLNGTAAILSDGPLQLFLSPALEMIKYEQDVNSDSTAYDLAIAWTYDATALTATDGRIGFTRREFDRADDGAINTLLLQAKALWNATPLLTFSAEAFSATADTQREAGIGTVTTGALLQADYELFENLVFTTSLRYINDSFSGVSRTDETFRYKLAAKYLIGEHYFLRADFGHESRASDDALEEFDDTTFLIRFGVKNCCLTDTGLVGAFGQGAGNVFR